MTTRRTAALAALAAGTGALAFGLPGPTIRRAAAQPSGALRVGMLTTLSGPGSPLGVDIRDGFALALENLQGRVGGAQTQVVEIDDRQQPDVAVQSVSRLIERENAQVVTGTIWSNLALAINPAIARAGAVHLSPNAGPSQLAGGQCSPNFFNVAFQNDNPHEAMGQHVGATAGVRDVVVVSPNYPAGRDAAAGFRRYYDRAGGQATEIFPRLGQLDFAAEIARVQAARPQAVYFFLPGGMGVNFVKQWTQSGLGRDVRLYGSCFSLSEDTLPAIGEDALGLENAAHWSPDLDNAVNRRFVPAFRQKYNRVPSLYAAAGHDAALALDAAVRAANSVEAAAIRGALGRVTFPCTRGTFRFGANRFPVQNQYLRVVDRLPDGALANRITGTIFADHVDAFAAECRA